MALTNGQSPTQIEFTGRAQGAADIEEVALGLREVIPVFGADELHDRVLSAVVVSHVCGLGGLTPPAQGRSVAVGNHRPAGKDGADPEFPVLAIGEVLPERADVIDQGPVKDAEDRDKTVLQDGEPLISRRGRSDSHEALTVRDSCRGEHDRVVGDDPPSLPLEEGQALGDITGQQHVVGVAEGDVITSGVSQSQVAGSSGASVFAFEDDDPITVGSTDGQGFIRTAIVDDDEFDVGLFWVSTPLIAAPMVLAALKAGITTLTRDGALIVDVS